MEWMKKFLWLFLLGGSAIIATVAASLIFSLKEPYPYFAALLIVGIVFVGVSFILSGEIKRKK
ncbi:MAG: hypothetical protein V1493_05245 [Candidatus Diapherotrites archaeon]